MTHFQRLGATAIALCLAAPAAAQSVSCGGIGDGAPWIGGAPGTSDIATSSGPLDATALQVAPNGRRVAVFTVGQPMDVRVEARPGDEFGDTVLWLYDADGTLIVTDDDSGGGLSSRAEVSLEAGRYCLAVEGFAGAPVVADARISRLEMPALTVGLAGGFAGTEGQPEFVGVQPCLSNSPATTLGNGPIDGQLSIGVVATNSPNAVPYYRFTLGAPAPITVRAENPVADPYIYLFDASGNLLAENDDYESLNSRIDMTDALPAGSYCIGMRALNDPDQPVTVTVRGFDQAAANAESYANADAAPPVDGSLYPVTFLGNLPAVTVRDTQVRGGQAVFFAFDVTEPGMLLIDATEVTDSDPWVRLFDQSGRMIGDNDDANGSLNSQLPVRILPGRYTLGVRQYSGGYQGIIRVSLQRFIPAQ